MAIENAIAQFGMNVGSRIQNTVGNALLSNENQRRYERQQNALMAQQEAAAEKEAEEFERQHVQSGVKAILSAPPEKRGLAYHGWYQDAARRGIDLSGVPSEYSDGALYTLAGAAGVDMGKTPGDLPSDVRSYQFYKGLPEEQRPEFLNVKRAGQPLNLSDRIIYRQPSGAEKVYQKGLPPQSQPQNIAAGEMAKANVALATKPGIQAEVAKASAKAKDEINAPKRAEKIRIITSGIDQTISSIDEALDLVGNRTTGAIGKALSVIPGTDAYTLKETALTVRANIGFDRLQAMRDASPTGGALGQVAVQELNALQASIRSLDLGLPADKLAENLNKVKQHYSNWRDAVTMSNDMQEKTAPEGYKLMEDASGNRAYVGPNGEIKEL